MGSEAEAGAAVRRALAAMEADDMAKESPRDLAMKKIDKAIAMIGDAGKVPGVIRLPQDAYSSFLGQALYGAGHEPPNVTRVLRYGYTPIIADRKLYSAVIVEAEDGEPFIVTDDLP